MAYNRSNERYRKFLEVLPSHNYNVTPSAIEAGFSKSYAQSKQKYIMNQALKFQLEQRGIEVVDRKDMPIEKVKRTMAEIIGITSDELMANIKYLANQEKDLATRLKVVRPLVKEFGVDLTDNEEKVTIMPTLNITVKSKNGSTEPLLPPL